MFAESVMPTMEYYSSVDRNEVPTNTCYKVNEPWKHDAKWKKPVKKDHTLYDYIHMKYPEYNDLYREKVDYWLPGV